MEELKTLVSRIGEVLGAFLGEGLPERVVSPTVEIYLKHQKQEKK